MFSLRYGEGNFDFKMKLFFRKRGQGIPLIILHGLYGSSDNWLTIARGLSERCEVFVPDMRNHGRSPHHPAHTYPALCDDVIELMNDNGIEQCILLGHSMGGKTAMHVVEKIPRRILKLIVDDIAPVNYSSLSDYSPLIVDHLNIANTLLHTDLTQYSRREEIDRAWAATIPDASVRQFLMKNVQRDGDRYVWRINIQAVVQNLPHLLNGMNIDPADGESRPIAACPALFLKGERSPYIRPEMYPFIRRVFPNSRIVVVPQAGHWLHAEQPALFSDEALRFIDEV